MPLNKPQNIFETNIKKPLDNPQMHATELQLYFSTTSQLFWYVFHFLDLSWISGKFYGNQERNKTGSRRDVLCQNISKQYFSFLLVSSVPMLNVGSKGLSQMNANVFKWTNGINWILSVNNNLLCKSRFPNIGLNMCPWTVFYVGKFLQVSLGMFALKILKKTNKKAPSVHLNFQI